MIKGVDMTLIDMQDDVVRWQRAADAIQEVYGLLRNLEGEHAETALALLNRLTEAVEEGSLSKKAELYAAENAAY